MRGDRPAVTHGSPLRGVQGDGAAPRPEAGGIWAAHDGAPGPSRPGTGHSCRTDRVHAVVIRPSMRGCQSRCI
ncbi:MAG: hypothetical protein MPL62_12020 [Alphaproteobacteria bacterium]|nr:hypothetical protein [Alphaproteobacteria bacterium]